MQKRVPVVGALTALSLITVGCGNTHTATTGAVKNSANTSVNKPSTAPAAPPNGTSNGTGHGSSKNNTATSPTKPVKFKQPKHIVVVVEENHGYNRIVSNKQAPYINSLIQHGALFTNYHAVAHPSQPNYLALFAGSTLGIHSDSCPHMFSKPNLGSELLANQLTFTGYSESLPSVGFTGCSTRVYARKHAPWVDFSNLPKKVNQPWSHFPKSFSQLPTVSFVIPNVKNDMHSGSVATGDNWLKQNLGAYAQWAKTHNSLLLITFDEGYSQQNRVATVFYGAGVKTGHYNQRFTHYSLLQTIESLYHLPPLANSKKAKPMTAALSY